MADVLKKVPVREQDAKVRATNFDEVCLGYNKEEAMEEAAELEEAVKTGRLGDRMSVEIYILERSRRTAPGGEDKK